MPTPSTFPLAATWKPRARTPIAGLTYVLAYARPGHRVGDLTQVVLTRVEDGLPVKQATVGPTVVSPRSYQITPDLPDGLPLVKPTMATLLPLLTALPVVMADMASYVTLIDAAWSADPSGGCGLDQLPIWPLWELIPDGTPDSRTTPILDRAASFAAQASSPVFPGPVDQADPSGAGVMLIHWVARREPVSTIPALGMIVGGKLTKPYVCPHRMGSAGSTAQSTLRHTRRQWDRIATPAGTLPPCGGRLRLIGDPGVTVRTLNQRLPDGWTVVDDPAAGVADGLLLTDPIGVHASCPETGRPVTRIVDAARVAEVASTDGRVVRI